MNRVQFHRFVDFAKPEQTGSNSPTGLDRRSFVTGAAVLAGITGIAPRAFARDFGLDQPQRYPDPDIVVLDDRFGGKVWNTTIERLYTGTLWAEGPAWNAVGR